MNSELDPDAPVFTPPPKHAARHISSENSTPSTSPSSVKEPQCSRYSRRSVRQPAFVNSPRPILGTKAPFPRPIMGRREEPIRDEADEYIGKEFRNLNRSFRRLKIKDDSLAKAQKEESLS